jgi:hypothetical protein
MGKPAKDQDKQQPESSSGSFVGGLEQLIGGMEARASRIKSLKRRSVKELAIYRLLDTSIYRSMPGPGVC